MTMPRNKILNKLMIRTIIMVSILIYCFIGCEKNELIKKPSVKTIRVENTTTSTTNAYGEFINLNDYEVVEYGFCLSESSGPTISDTKILLDTVKSTFNKEIVGLDPGKTYYLRAFATNNIGTGYGDELNFTTEDGVFLVTTLDILDITTESAKCGGRITNTKGAEIISKGVCWSTSENPSLSDLHTDDGNGDDDFTSTLTGLDPNTTYYIKAYASTSDETVDGEQVILKTYHNIVQDFDENEYFTVYIGDQLWMAENLKTTHYASGDPILLVTGNSSWESLTEGAYCYYNNDSVTYADTYGALYNWYVIEDSRNVCPLGWHVATDDEWMEMEMFLGMSQNDAQGQGMRGTDEGGKLKETGINNWNSPNAGATNETGFTALPAGARSSNGSFEDIGNTGYSWVNSKLDDLGTLRCFVYDDPKLGRWWYSCNMGLSIRCIKDDVTKGSNKTIAQIERQ